MKERAAMPQKQSMSDQVLHRLREGIVNCVYKPGEIITETEVAQRYGSSKTPAREALSTLCLEEYLQKFPRKGYLVKASPSRIFKACSNSAAFWNALPLLSLRACLRGGNPAAPVHLRQIERFEDRTAGITAGQHDAATPHFICRLRACRAIPT